jgi:hypothetical protein
MKFLYNLVKAIPFHIELFHSSNRRLLAITPFLTLSSEFGFVERKRLAFYGNISKLLLSYLTEIDSDGISCIPFYHILAAWYSFFKKLIDFNYTP